MPKLPPRHFHLRLPEEVFAFLMGEKGDNSLNKEIVERLRGSMAQGEVDSLGAALRSILNTVDPADREELTAIALRAIEILAKSRAKRRR